MKLLLATGNPHKVEEMTALLAGLPVAIASILDFPGGPQVDENGATYEANAVLKARAWAAHAGLVALADDSGLEVEALGGRPGVRSNRYAATSDERIHGILREMEGVEEARRTARFICVMALACPAGHGHPNGVVETRRGVCEGRIALAPAGQGGFGYDPIFFLPDRGVTMAQLSAAEKNLISHRARAAQAIAPLIATGLSHCPPPLHSI